MNTREAVDVLGRVMYNGRYAFRQPGLIGITKLSSMAEKIIPA